MSSPIRLDLADIPHKYLALVRMEFIDEIRAYKIIITPTPPRPRTGDSCAEPSLRVLFERLDNLQKEIAKLYDLDFTQRFCEVVLDFGGAKILIHHVPVDMPPWRSLVGEKESRGEIWGAIDPAGLTSLERVLYSGLEDRTAGIEASHSIEDLSPSEKRVAMLWRRALGERPELETKTDQELYDYIKAELLEQGEEPLRDFGTFTRYLRKVRAVLGAQKN